MAGKGDKPRPVNHRVYGDNYDRIFRKGGKFVDDFVGAVTRASACIREAQTKAQANGDFNTARATGGLLFWPREGNQVKAHEVAFVAALKHPLSWKQDNEPSLEFVPGDPHIERYSDGWWFWDEVGTFRCGPFETAKLAQDALTIYADNL